MSASTSRASARGRSSLVVGALIEARFQAAQFGTARTRWFKGRVASVPDANGCYDIQYDDGDFEKAVPANFIRTRSLPSEVPVRGSGAVIPTGVGKRKARATATPGPTRCKPCAACLELQVLAPLLASFESNFGKKRAAPWVGSRPENVYGLTSLLSMVCSDWQEAVRALQSDLRTVDAGFYGFPGCKQGLVSLVASKGNQ